MDKNEITILIPEETRLQKAWRKYFMFLHEVVCLKESERNEYSLKVANEIKAIIKEMSTEEKEEFYKRIKNHEK